MRAPPTSLTQAYGYDNTNRLTSATTSSTSLNSYGYDAADHLTQIATAGTATNLAYDRADELTTATTPASGESVAYLYDAKGNRTRQTMTVGAASAAATMTLDQANRLVGYSGPPVTAATDATQLGGVSQVSYAYNGDGLRADLVYDLAEGLPLILSDSLAGSTNVNTANAFYITGPGGLPLERIDGASNALYFHQDQLGSTRALTNGDGHVVVTYTYDPYGNATPSTTAIHNPFQYAGQFVDASTGLIYMRARWYDPTVGQFLNRDPITAVTGQPYSYANDSPLNGSDPSGLIDLGGGVCLHVPFTNDHCDAPGLQNLCIRHVQDNCERSTFGEHFVAQWSGCYGVCFAASEQGGSVDVKVGGVGFSPRGPGIGWAKLPPEQRRKRSVAIGAQYGPGMTFSYGIDCKGQIDPNDSEVDFQVGPPGLQLPTPFFPMSPVLHGDTNIL